MTKSNATDKLLNLKKNAELLINKPSGSQEFKKWYRDTEIAIENIFGKDTRHIKDFENIRYSLYVVTTSTPKYEFEKAYQKGVKSAITLIESFIDEINEYWDNAEENEIEQTSHLDKVELIIRRFHRIARQLRSRHANRKTIEIEDEYDVQDLFHALLKLYFDDIRPEEYTPSYAGASSRVDFLLKKEKTIIEIKKTRKNLSAKEVGEQLIIDSQRYQAHPDCDRIICFVYDPEGRIANPKGIENDLTKELNGIPFLVFITPEQ